MVMKTSVLTFQHCVDLFGYHDLPKWTGTDRNGLTKIPKRTSMGTETDFTGYRNGPEQTSAHTETNFNGKQKRGGVG